MSELKLEQIGHPDAVSNALTFDSDGSITVNGSISGNLTVTGNVIANSTSDYEIEMLLVAGGGAGGAGNGGAGGGAGGLVHMRLFVSQDSDYSITIGAGGAGANNTIQNDGNNSNFGSIVAIGGGAGGTNSGPTVGNGRPGGSGGGSSGDGASTGYTNPPGAGTDGQGNYGGNGWEESGFNAGGGGGGAGSPGHPAIKSDAGYFTAGHGGAPALLDIDGSMKPYAGGGGGCPQDTSGTLRIGRGGQGSGGDGTSGSGTADSGVINTGGGGGGNQSGGIGGSGGSGVCVVRYPGAQRGTGGTITSVNGFTIHKFTSSGTFSP